MRLIRTNTILNWLYGEAISYPTPTSLSFFWSFGVMALICLISQIASGIFLAMHYIPSAELAFSSVEHIMWDVRGGWFLRYLHANGASMFFLVVYLHISWGLYYNSFAGWRQFVWYSGIIILFIMILTAFLGYVLPWGQMSFWAATVITSLASAVPLVGDSIVAWLWGGFSVGEQTLVRFFSLHYLLPFVLFALVAAHIVLLHETGSNTPTGINLNWGDRVTFGPYFFLKDLYYLVLFFIVFMYFVFFNSNYLGHPDNYIPAMYMSTPAHIVPEWYFLPFYALLRSIPDKLGGVIVMLFSIVGLAILPTLLNLSSKRFILNSNFNLPRALFFSFFIANSLLLGWIGGQPIEEPMYTVGQYSSLFYFILIFIIFPVMNTYLTIDLSLETNTEDHYNWWELLYAAISDFIGFLLKFRRKFIFFFGNRYRYRYEDLDIYFYERGDDDVFPEEEWKSPDDYGYVGYKKNFAQRRFNFFVNEQVKFNIEMEKLLIGKIDDIIAYQNLTPKKQERLNNAVTRLLQHKKDLFFAIIPTPVKKILNILFPPANAFCRTTDLKKNFDRYNTNRLSSMWHPDVLDRIDELVSTAIKNYGVDDIYCVPKDEKKVKPLSWEELKHKFLISKGKSDQICINFLFEYHPELIDLSKKNPSKTKRDILVEYLNKK